MQIINKVLIVHVNHHPKILIKIFFLFNLLMKNITWKGPNGLKMKIPERTSMHIYSTIIYLRRYLPMSSMIMNGSFNICWVFNWCKGQGSLGRNKCVRFAKENMRERDLLHIFTVLQKNRFLFANTINFS